MCDTDLDLDLEFAPDQDGFQVTPFADRHTATSC